MYIKYLSNGRPRTSYTQYIEFQAGRQEYGTEVGHTYVVFASGGHSYLIDTDKIVSISEEE